MERRLTTLMGRMSPYLRQAARTPDSGHDKRFTICVTKASRDTARVRAEARCNQGDPREDGQGLARARVWVRCHQREPRDGRIEKKKKERERDRRTTTPDVSHRNACRRGNPTKRTASSA